MSDILIDNWTLERAAYSMHDFMYENAIPNEDFVRLVEAIILWDNLYYIDSTSSYVWRSILSEFGCSDCILPLPFNGDDLYENFWTYSDVICGGALKYIELCKMKGISYMPCKERADFLCQFDNLNAGIGRKDVIGCLDTLLSRYYESVCDRFGIRKLKHSFPILFEYVLKNSSHNNCYIETALQIKQTEEVIRFRRWLSCFEEEIQKGNILEVERLLSYISVILERMVKRFSPKNVEVQIGLPISFSFGANLGCFSLYSNDVHFIDQLIIFGIKEREIQMPVYIAY